MAHLKKTKKLRWKVAFAVLAARSAPFLATRCKSFLYRTMLSAFYFHDEVLLKHYCNHKSPRGEIHEVKMNESKKHAARSHFESRLDPLEISCFVPFGLSTQELSSYQTLTPLPKLFARYYANQACFILHHRYNLKIAPFCVSTKYICVCDICVDFSSLC